MQLQNRGQNFARHALEQRVGGARKLRELTLDAREPLLEIALCVASLAHLCAPKLGACCTRSSFPPPRYMCTPHGKQGSKLRTVRMMSTPLNLSRPFSSNSGMFCTASSYGPGVPYESRGLAFQGVGG